MKLIMKKYIVLLTFCVVALSCDDDMEFLQPDPPSLLTEEAAFQSISGVEGVVASAYNRLINFNNYGQRMMIAPDALADNLEIGQNTGRYTGEVVNTARDHINLMNDPGNPDGLAYTIRRSYNAYRAIQDCNLAIYALDELGLRDEDPALAAILEGEAKFIRALSYFDLLRIYSYEPGNEVNGWNAGVVLRTEPVLGASDADARARSTNVEVYAQVEADLNDAINLLPAEADNADFPNRASTTAARALKARMHLYLGEYTEAATEADAVLAATTATLTDAASHVASWSATNHPEAIFELAVSANDWNTVDGINNSLATVTRVDQPGFANSQGAVKASDELLAAFEAGDIRATMWVAQGADYFEGTKWNGELGDFRENIPIIRYSEVLLIAAEAKARSGNEAGAQTDVSTLRTNRGLAATVLTGSALTDLILNERRVELVLEGHRWFDLKRLQMDVPKPADLGVGATLSATDFRILGDINNDYIAINPSVEQNPGY